MWAGFTSVDSTRLDSVVSMYSRYMYLVVALIIWYRWKKSTAEGGGIEGREKEGGGYYGFIAS